MLTPSQNITHPSHLSPLTNCSYIISKLHFKQNVSTKSSETHFKTERRVEKGGGELKVRERDRKRETERVDCIGFECLGPSCK